MKTIWIVPALAVCGCTLDSSLPPDAGAIDAAVADAVVPDATAPDATLPFAQQAYLKASNTGSGDELGGTIALSADGSTLAVGVSFEDSAATGIDGNQADDSATASGAVYVFVRSGATWTQQAYVKASNTGAGDVFSAVALSGDGATLAVGAPGERSAATGIDGDQADNAAGNSGAVYVFARAGTTWSQQSYLKASNTQAGDSFGGSVALSSDGTTLAVGAGEEDSVATGVGGNQADNTAADSGAVYVFTRSGVTWTQQAYVKASNTDAGDKFGIVALSADGSTLAVGAEGEASAATGVDGDQADDSGTNAGAAYVFHRTGITWTQQAYVKESNTGGTDLFGRRVSLSGDGTTLAVGALLEDSAATGIDGAQANEGAPESGAVYVYTRAGATWTQQAYIKASNTDDTEYFGRSVSLSGDGARLAVGADGEDSSATGVDGNQADNLAPGSGAAYLFTRAGTTWTQDAYVKASNTQSSDRFGYAVAWAADDPTLAVVAIVEASAATGVDGDQTDDSAADSGAVYIFR